jgi:hypothetical protein
MANQAYRSTGYGLSDALPNIFPAPVVSKRVPQNSDTGYQLGQEWIVPSVPSAYILVKVAAGVATWQLIEASGSAGNFSSLNVTPGPVNLFGAVGINTVGAGVTTINTGGTGALNLGNATGNTAVTGSLTTSTTLTATLGNITATNGDVVVSTATKGLVLPGGLKVITGAGSPSGAVTAPQGSLYLNSTGSSTSTRAYINTDAGTTWTAITTAA